jgi:Uma2 family endonuclease
MLQLKPRFQTFEEYLTYNDNSDQLYELFNGELIEMPPESGLNVEIATLLLIKFVPIFGYQRVRGQGLELEVKGEPKNRYPDLTILREEHIKLLKNRNTIRLSMLPPLLVIEIVSPGELQRERDYLAKRSQYQDCRIPEYWIVDPQTETILVLTLQGNNYQEIGNFTGDNLVISSQFSEINLKPSSIF